MSDTPRVDAAYERVSSEDGLPGSMCHPVELLAEVDAVARQLERELAESIAKYDILGRAHANRLIELSAAQSKLAEVEEAQARADRTLRMMLGNEHYERLKGIAEKALETYSK